MERTCTLTGVHELKQTIVSLITRGEGGRSTPQPRLRPCCVLSHHAEAWWLPLQYDCNNTVAQGLLLNIHSNVPLLRAVDIMQASASKRSGFPSNIFCSQVKSEPYHCLICFEVCRSPVTCRSGAHLFCFDCLTESLRQNPTCPVCREPLVAPLPSAFASAQVSALDVVCIHDTCKWKGTCGRFPRKKIMHAILQRIMLNLARIMHDFRTIMHDHA